ncbi:MAG: hypothetical protein ACP5I8_11715 [Phycisphaerae bacterium]
MTQVTASGTLQRQVMQQWILPCPGNQCRGSLTPATNGIFQCDTCRMQVNAELFNPVTPVIQSPELAMSEDATCVYHPQKKAVTVCQGTGNFICALCAVEVKGKTYSVQYLESNAGKKVADEIINRYLPRPDRVVNNILVALFIPYADAVVFILFPLWAVYGYFQCGKMAKMRRENTLYHDLVGNGRIVTGAILLSIVLAVWLALAVAMIFFGHFHGGVTVFHTRP